ncbi:class II fructose-bisphosphatase [Chloracidobacterium sp. D]|jgi:fructose-1,6-bisphosphatase class II|uniref:class II fructose-bisphosphatase n=1 Tax=Chloracidobacterium sp. D TaxID=2821536 RepID=UPI001B8C82B1|nr:class II fructose-bisphosphatase [Chloracidobacterium sp. D]QUV80812.1 class II fructose-bisphosphatase [Chloracidobacterium sp. D]
MSAETTETRFSHLSKEFLHVVEVAAIAAARTMGFGQRKQSDRAAVEAMREAMRTVRMNGRIVIGEGERDKAPMLYIGERVGAGAELPDDDETFPAVDIAVDPLEGTNLCATGAANAIAVLAAAERGGLLHAPDMYMNKLVVGPAAKGKLDIDAPVAENLKILSDCLRRAVTDLVVSVLDRPRHARLIADIREAGARIQLISDGDLSAGISAAIGGSGVHAVMGIGGAPEGVLTAAAMKCLNGEIQARFVLKDQLHAEDHTKVTEDSETLARMRAMGIADPARVYRTDDLAPGKHIIFAMTGVTNGTVLRGVRFFGAGKRTSSLLMTTCPHTVRLVDTVHVEGGPDTVIRL